MVPVSLATAWASDCRVSGASGRNAVAGPRKMPRVVTSSICGSAHDCVVPAAAAGETGIAQQNASAASRFANLLTRLISARTGERGRLVRVRLELEPAQPEAVVRAVATLLEAPGRPVDPWWQAGLEEALGEGAVARRGSRPVVAGLLRAQGEATARPRRMRGAERA